MHKLPEKPPDDWDRAFISGDCTLIADPGLRKDVAEYNRRYLSWDELKYRIPDPERRAITWAMMKWLRVIQYEHIPFKQLALTYSFTPGIAKILQTIDRYLSGTLPLHDPSVTLEKTCAINALMEEAIASSILEGAATTRKAAKEMLQKGRKPKNDSERMVQNNYEAMQCIRGKKDEALSPPIILDIHRIVMKGTTDEERAGHFRTSNDIVVADPATGVVYHTPPDFSRIDEFIEELCAFANSDDTGSGNSGDTFIHPVIKGIILHYLIGYLHPFNDGNGRTARSLFYWYVLSRGYWLFEYMPISRIIQRSKRKYARAYLITEYDEPDLTYFLWYNVSCISEALTDLRAYLGEQQGRQDASNTLIQAIREINPRQAEILRAMKEHPRDFFTIRQVMRVYGTVYETARTDLLHLAALGYVRQEKRGREFLFIFNDRSNSG